MIALDKFPPSLDAGSVIRDLAPGEFLFEQGNRASAIYKVESGRLRLIRRTVDDHLVVLHTARQGEFFAEASLFSEVYHCDAIAAAESRVRVYPKAKVLDALRADPLATEALMARLAHQLQELRARMELRNVRSARERAIQYFRLRAGFHGRSIAIEGQLQDIAAEIGLTREALYRGWRVSKPKGLSPGRKRQSWSRNLTTHDPNHTDVANSRIGWRGSTSAKRDFPCLPPVDSLSLVPCSQ